MIDPKQYLKTLIKKTGFDGEGVPALEANYHTHTWRCHHASGTEREYVEAAIEGGMKVLGFSDHTPYPFPNGYCSSFRMEVSQLEGYVATVEKLREEYRDDIDIRIGLEVEYYPEFFDDLTHLTDQYPIEYYILGQHFIGNEFGEAYSAVPSVSVEKLHRYVEQVKEGMDTGRFVYVAHPDLFYFIGSDEHYEREMRSLCQHAKKKGIPLEINFLGLFEGRSYPRQLFWKIAGEVGNQVIFGCDAHKPDMVNNPFSMQEALNMTEKYGLERIVFLDLEYQITPRP
ncbi:MAG: histidinol-phosphatase [Lachnospiraceae bacterium]|nr:histidinol-phosphatase [Lachnospiraceae bacterium]